MTAAVATAIMADGFVVQMMGGDLIWTAAGWLWFPRGKEGRRGR